MIRLDTVPDDLYDTSFIVRLGLYSSRALKLLDELTCGNEYVKQITWNKFHISNVNYNKFVVPMIDGELHLQMFGCIGKTNDKEDYGLAMNEFKTVFQILFDNWFSKKSSTSSKRKLKDMQLLQRMLMDNEKCGPKYDFLIGMPLNPFKQELMKVYYDTRERLMQEEVKCKMNKDKQFVITEELLSFHDKIKQVGEAIMRTFSENEFKKRKHLEVG